jgi:predicted PP-loop superfamily ATPase
VYHDRKSGRHLCREHFIVDVELRVADTLRSRKLIVPGDRVAIALSGGKDSTVSMVTGRIPCGRLTIW